ILFMFHAQHNCTNGRCQVVESEQAQQQERHDTSRKIKLLRHEDDAIFLVNMHALHNADLICEILPRQLTAP
ncbi:hypothetical protein FIBSPDRAFT_704266, partial [Athelia psychrophila]